jgi:hypothetical protein
MESSALSATYTVASGEKLSIEGKIVQSNSIPIEDNDCYFHFVYLEGIIEVQRETDIFSFSKSILQK